MASVWTVRDEGGTEFQVDENRLPEAEKDGFLPVVSNGKDVHRVAVSDIPLAMKDGFSPLFAQENAPKVEKESGIMSAVRSGLQGIYAGMSDEVAGVVEGAGRIVGLKGAGGPLKDVSISEDGPTVDPSKLKEAYIDGRDREREALKKDSRDNPVISTVANVAGAIVSPANKLAKGVGLVKGAARVGALTAAGMSDAETADGVVEDVAKGTVLGAASAKALQNAQSLAGTATRALADKISPYRQKMNTEEIIEAARRMGIKVTPGMLDDTGFVERLESALSKSPSLFGQSVARNRDKVTNRLNEIGQEVTAEASNQSPYQIGESFKEGVTAKVGERLDPISAVFTEVAESTKNIPVGEKSKAAIVRNIEGLSTYRLTGGKGKPGEYVDMIGRIQNVDEVKTVLTMLNNDIRAASGSEKQVLLGIKEKLSTLEKNSTVRGAISAAKEGGMRETTGKRIGMEIVGDLKDARKGYRELSEDLQGVAENARIKTQKGPSAFLDAVDQIPSERIQDKFFNVQNNRQLMTLKSKFPDQFELLRQGKIKDIVDRSVDNSVNGQGRFSTQKFLKEVGDLNDEAKAMLFEGKTNILKDIETVHRSLPRNFNPSGTASESGWQDAIYRNVRDLPTYALYRAASTNLGKGISDSLIKAPQMVELYHKSPQAYHTIVQKIENNVGFISPKQISVPKAADGKENNKDRPVVDLKGANKWAVDGYSKLLEHDNSGSLSNDQAVEKLFSTPKGRDLLIKASDLKPGTKAMDDLMTKIKARTSEGQQ